MPSSFELTEVSRLAKAGRAHALYHAEFADTVLGVFLGSQRGFPFILAAPALAPTPVFCIAAAQRVVPVRRVLLLRLWHPKALAGGRFFYLWSRPHHRATQALVVEIRRGCL